MLAEQFLNKGLVPDVLIRYKIRNLLRDRLQQERQSNQAYFVDLIRSGPIAVCTQSANDQHYEVPAAFFEKILGPRMKYSCAYFDNPSETLASAEEKMLALTAERAELFDGQQVLELGCGWGSLTFWIAEKYPQSQILAVSNSNSQREFILNKIKARGFKNIQVITQDMNLFTTNLRFDRVISVEMFEHMRNIELLLSRIAGWLKADGRLFVHIFTHCNYAYLFEDHDSSDWLARHFFTGGMMPNRSLFHHFTSDLRVEQDWNLSGTHYALTATRWLENMDRHSAEIRKILQKTYGNHALSLWWNRWRVFFMACEELWGFDSGNQWGVSHFRFKKAQL